MAGGLLLIILPTLIFIIALKLITTISKPNKNTATTTTNLPPGPTFISIIGNLLLLRKNLLHIKPMLHSLRAKYSPIFSFPLTSHPSILTSDRTLIHEALIQKGVVFADRPPGLMTNNQLRVLSGATFAATSSLRSSILVASSFSPQLAAAASTSSSMISNLSPLAPAQAPSLL